jgi:hypothetical protein
MVDLTKATVAPRFNFSKEAGFFYSLVSLVSAPLAFSDRSLTFVQASLLSLAVTLVALGIYFSLMLVAEVLTRLAAVKVALFFLSVTLIGLSRGYLLWALSPLAGIEQNATLEQRLGISLLMTFIWLPTISWVIQNHKAYKRKLNVALNQLAHALAQSENENIADKIDSLEPVIALKNNLTTIAANAADLPNSTTLIESAEGIKNQIEDIIRPLSHQLWGGSMNRGIKGSLIALIRSALENFKVNTGRLLLAIGIVGAIGGISLGDSKRTLILTCIPVAWVALLNYVRTRWSDQIPAFRTALSRVVFVAISGISAVVLCDLTGVASGFDSELLPFTLVALLAPLPIMALLFLESLVNQVLLNREQTLETMRNNVTRVEDYFGTNFASYLHNSIQSELTSIALQLRALTNDLDAQKLSETIERLQAISQMSLGSEFLARTDSPRSRLEKMATSWDGIAKVSLKLSDPDLAEFRVSSILVPMVEEAVANSIRHGGATVVRVRVWGEDGNTQVEIFNNGKLAESGDGGMGSKWISSLSLRDYAPVLKNGGTVLRFEI